MIVGNMLVAEVLARHLVVRQQVGPGAQLRPGWRRTRGIEIRQPDHRLQRRQGIDDAAYLRFASEILPAETIAIGCEQHFGFNLREAFDHGLDAELWRGRRSEEHTSELQSLMRIS